MGSESIRPGGWGDVMFGLRKDSKNGNGRKKGGDRPKSRGEEWGREELEFLGKDC